VADFENNMLNQVVSSLLDGMRDVRIPEAIRKGLLDELLDFVQNGFFDDLGARIEKEQIAFPGFPDEVETTVQALNWIFAEAVEHKDLAVSIVAGRVGVFISVNRQKILEILVSLGKGPSADRDVIAKDIAATLDSIRSNAGVDEPAEKSSASKAQDDLDPLLERLEELREQLENLILDDQLLGYPSESNPLKPEAPPGVILLRESWILETDLWVQAAQRVGDELPEGAVGSYEQHPFLLGAIVALQEALTLGTNHEDLLRLAALRHAKGDVGEARLICERLEEVVEDPDFLSRIEALQDSISDSSPLGGKDKRCFIATAAMGDPDAFEVVILRQWRDETLMSTGLGRLFVRYYYAYSPYLADFIAKHPLVGAAVRRLVVVPVARLVSK